MVYCTVLEIGLMTLFHMHAGFPSVLYQAKMNGLDFLEHGRKTPVIKDQDSGFLCLTKENQLKFDSRQI